MTPEEYLVRERAADFRSEYRDGVVVAMAGASRAHNRIVFNISGQFYNQLRGGECGAYSSDMKVRLPGTLRYVYPDIVVACGEQDFQDEQEDVLTNPILIIEVLSESTEAYDRGEKWERYQRLLSLQEYVLVSQNRATIERFVRQGDLWIYSLTADPAGSVSLQSISVVLQLADVYERVSIASYENNADL